MILKKIFSPMRIKVTAATIITIGLVIIAFYFIALAVTDAPHNASNNIDCPSCHGEGILISPFRGGSYIPATPDDTIYNNLCRSCHTETSPGQGGYPETKGPIVNTHSDYSITGGDGWARECRDCHNPHYQRQKVYKNTDANNLYLATGTIVSCVYNGDNTSTLTYSTITYKTGWDAARLTEKTGEYRRTILFPNVNKLGYNYPITDIDTDAKTIKVTGNATTILYPPTTFAAMYGQYIKDFIDVNGTNKQVKFLDQTGTNSYADGDGIYNGVCEVCHTLTDHFRNNGGAPDQNHANVGGAGGTNCTTCHKHIDGFAHGGETGTGCEGCHGHDDGWNGGSYYGTMQSHSTHTENDSDDLKGPNITCADCHDTDNYPRFRDGKNFSETTVCNSCHSPGGVFDGVIDTQIGAKANWETGVYEGNSLRTGKEQWCATCHDNASAVSKKQFIDLVVVDNIDHGASFEGSWGTSSYAAGYYGSNYHYHVAGSGADTFTWTPTITTAGRHQVFARWTTSGVEPDNSRANHATYTIYHDGGSTVVEVDQQRDGGEWVSLGTYSFDGAGDEKVELGQSASGIVIADAIVWCSPDGSPPPKPGIYAPNVIGDNSIYGFYATGHGAHGWVECLSCHNAGTKHIDHKHRTYASASNNYQAGYRLAKPLVIPRPNRSDIYANLNDFALCNDCHNPYEILGVNYSDESHTNFREDAAPLRNGHNVHIEMAGDVFDSDWDRVRDSMPTCITCHNVHGPPNQAMVRHGELMSTYGTTDKVPGLNFSYLTSLSPKVYDTEADVKDSVASTLRWVDSSFEVNGFCNGACHGGKTMIRTPYLGPKVLTKKAYPNSVPADGKTEVLITALVADHNDNVPSDGVTIDLTAIEGDAAQLMYDDGINGGDLTAGDKIYSYTLTVPDTVTSGFKSLHVTATDPDGVGEGNITLHVQAPGEIILDNTEATYTGTWPLFANLTAYGGEAQYHEAGSGANTATWTPIILEAGNYNVYAWWVAHTNRATNALYTINYAGGSAELRVNQQINGGKWNLLGTYPFTVGTSGYIRLSDDVNGYINADAIKFELQP
jgi:hypothetical protein